MAVNDSTVLNPFADATAATMLDAVAAQYPERLAMVSGDERVTFGDFRARTERLAYGLLALGIRKGDTVAIWLPNRPAWWVAQILCARIGAGVVALNPRYRAQDKPQKNKLRQPLIEELGP
jgi:fatty-acyl-CoA synthase